MLAVAADTGPWTFQRGNTTDTEPIAALEGKLTANGVDFAAFQAAAAPLYDSPTSVDVIGTDMIAATSAALGIEQAQERPDIDRLTDIIDRLDRWAGAALDVAVVALSGLLLILLNRAAFVRFIVNDSVSWGKEPPAHILTTLTFIGAACLTHTNAHVGFDAVCG